jgi:hypothetical protein
MTETPMKMYWMGEDVETLHRDVLMEIIRHLHKEVESTRSILRATIDIDRAAREAQRRLEPFPLKHEA